MRTLMPYLSVLLALIAAGSIIYIAWDLTSEKRHGLDTPKSTGAGDDETPDEPER